MQTEYGTGLPVGQSKVRKKMPMVTVPHVY